MMSGMEQQPTNGSTEFTSTSTFMQMFPSSPHCFITKIVVTVLVISNAKGPLQSWRFGAWNIAAQWARSSLWLSTGQVKSQVLEQRGFHIKQICHLFLYCQLHVLTASFEKAEHIDEMVYICMFMLHLLWTACSIIPRVVGSSLGCTMKKSGTMASTVWGYRRMILWVV